MTKKTDSLIFRYGTQTLWRNTSFLFKISISTSFFFKFLYFELQQRKFELLCIEQKFSNLVYAFVFCFFWQKKYFGYGRNNCTIYLKILLFYRYWLVLNIFFSCFYLILNNKFQFFHISSLLFLVNHEHYISFSKRDFYYPVNCKRVDTLVFKIEQLRLENQISLFFARPFYIKLQNIFHLPLFFDFVQLTRRSQFSKNLLKSGLSTLEFMLYISCKVRIISMFTRYFAQLLGREKKHKKLLWQAVNAIQLINKHWSLFKAIRIYVTGKLNGKMRKKNYCFKLGRLPMQRIDLNLDHFKSLSFTKFGTISIKVWILF